MNDFTIWGYYNVIAPILYAHFQPSFRHRYVGFTVFPDKTSYMMVVAYVKSVMAEYAGYVEIPANSDKSIIPILYPKNITLDKILKSSNLKDTIYNTLIKYRLDTAITPSRHPYTMKVVEDLTEILTNNINRIK